MKPAPDPDGVRSAKAGDKAAFERLLRPLIDPAYRFACVMLNDPDECVARCVGPVRATVVPLAIGDPDCSRFTRFGATDGTVCSAFLIHLQAA